MSSTVATALTEEAHARGSPDRASFTYVAPDPRRSHSSVGRRLQGHRHRQHPRPGRWCAEYPFSHLGHARPLLLELRPVVQQRPAHPQALVSLRSRAPGHHVCQHSDLGLDLQRCQVMDLGHYLP
jgi:hypothetical protein